MSPQQGRFAEVAVCLPLDGLYTYKIPSQMSLQVGHAVLVPFGAKKISAYVVNIVDQTSIGRLKYVSKILDPEPVFEASDLRFFNWIAKYYLSGLGEVISTALPRDYKAKSVRVYTATEKGIDALANNECSNQNHGRILREVISKPNRTSRGLARNFSDDLEHPKVQRILNALIKKEWVHCEEKYKGGPKAKTKFVLLTGNTEAERAVKGARSTAALNAIQDADGEIELNELIKQEGPTIRAAVKRLEEKGVVFIDLRENRSNAKFKTLPAQSTPHTLNDQQQLAYDQMCTNEHTVFLLHGVTGAGKTEVYLQAARHHLNNGRQTLVLVPEIALTPLLIGRVKARFGDRVAALHSGLSSSERLREWRRIRAGEADVAVGARSALFAPFPNLGLIIVDEEHDDSYKQGDGVRYNARDLAVVRGLFENCPVVLGSATPNVETWYNAHTGKYNLLRIDKRATPKSVPTITMVDMRGRPPVEIISPEVETALRETFAAGGSAIVLYNRRGYAPVVECPGCGSTYTCPSCGVNLVLHQRSRKVSCHYCSFYRNYHTECQVCSTPMNIIGHGTERVEEELAILFPTVGISRMDADTTSTKGAHHRILETFRTGQTRLLVGTQLVAKGHDFPNVTLAAVIGVDHILTLPDFRSAERTYSLVTQLAGRAGRGKQAGHVLVQTRHPDHFVFRLLNAQNLPDPSHVFYQQEVRQRKILKYPPESRLVLIRLEGEDRDRVRSSAGELARKLRDLSRNRKDINILGPTMAPLSKLIGRYRIQLIIRGNAPTSFRTWLNQVRHILRESSFASIRIVIDVDPRNLL